MRKPNRAHIIGVLCAVCVVMLACLVALPLHTPSQDENAQSPAVRQFQAVPEASALQVRPNPEKGDAVDAAGSATAADDPAVEAGVYDGETVLASIPAGIAPEEAVSAIVEETGLDGLSLVGESAPAPTADTDEAVTVELALPAGVGVQDAIGRIGATSAVDDVQPNFLYYIQEDEQGQTGADKATELIVATQKMLSTGLTTQATTVSDAEGLWGLKSINAYKGAAGSAWSKQKVNNSVGVAVIDEGFDAYHEDLESNVKATYNATDGTSSVSEVFSQFGHGTHVAGIVSARANNDKGVAGVSYNADLVLIKVMNSRGSMSTSGIVKAFNYAIANKAKYNIRVINMSIGGKWNNFDNLDSADKAMIKAIDRAVANDIVVVCSGGNVDEEHGWYVPFIDFPADYESVVGVINLRQSGSGVVRSERSNYNMHISTPKMPGGKNISAPGTDIESTMPGSKYDSKSGTSMASPYVAGALALAFAKNPNLSARDAPSLLYSTAMDIGSAGWDIETGYGELNVYAMVDGGGYLSGSTSVKAGKSIVLKPSVSGSWTWASSDTSVAKVSNGKVTGVSGGKARISATGKVNGKQTTLYKDVFVYKAKITGAASVTVGKTARLTLESTPYGCWTWSSSDKSVATVNGNGVVKGLKPGKTVKITARLSSNKSIAVSKTIKVCARSISAAKVKLSSKSFTYNGKVHNPRVVSVVLGGKKLKAKRDYKVAYSAGCKKAGTYTVKITGIGNYRGTVKAKFTIKRKAG